MKPDPRPKHPVAMTRPVMRRVAKAVRRVEAAWVRPPDQRVGRITLWQPGVLRAIVVDPIPSGTPASPSISGTVAIQRWDAINATGEADPVLTGERCCNDHALSGSAGTGKTVKVSWIDGDYWLVQADC